MKRINDIKQLKLISNTIRQDIIRMLAEAGSGHSAGPLGMADIFTALYFNVLNHNPKNPDWDERDRLILSNGHICPVRYAAMANAGYFPREELTTLRKLGTRLQGHPHRTALPGVETTSGPLGSGLSQAAGIAYAAKIIDGKKFRIYCLMSDGEQQCGNVWEAAMFAAKYNLSNITAIVDRNNIQIDGFVDYVMPLEPFREKYESFNWHAIDADGHSISNFIDACNEAKAITEKPTVIIANTVPGKGVSFMENNYEWHGKPPAKEEAELALSELQRERELIMGDKL